MIELRQGGQEFAPNALEITPSNITDPNIQAMEWGDDEERRRFIEALARGIETGQDTDGSLAYALYQTIIHTDRLFNADELLRLIDVVSAGDKGKKVDAIAPSDFYLPLDADGKYDRGDQTKNVLISRLVSIIISQFDFQRYLLSPERKQFYLDDLAKLEKLYEAMPERRATNYDSRHDLEINHIAKVRANVERL